MNMAHMYPADGPSADTTSHGEIKVYQALQMLDDSYHIFHHTPWFEKPSIKSNDRYKIGENDFVIIHPAKGIIVLEIKGGSVRLDGKKFYTRPLLGPGKGREHEDSNPFEQGRNFLFALRRFLQETYTTAKYIDMYRVIEAVWFPDITWTQTDMLQFDRRQIFDELDLAAPEKALDRVYGILKQSVSFPAMSDDALQRVIKVLAPGGKPHQTLQALFERNRRKLDQLTEEQVNGLRNMRLLKRIAFYGGAGTGKTVLAFEIAAQLADEGMRVLFLCFNFEQAEFLRGNNHEKPSDHAPRFDIRYPVLLYKHLADLAKHDPKLIDNLKIFDSRDRLEIAALMTQCIDTLSANPQAPPWQFDAIIIDEAQNLALPFWNPIQRLLSDPKEGRLYIFFDESQQIDVAAQELKPILDGFENKVPLEKNVRNTRQIYALMREFNPNLPAMTPTTSGKEVRYINLKPYQRGNVPREDAEIAALTATLDTLVAEEVDERDILLITCRSNFRTRFGNLESVGNHTLRKIRLKEKVGAIKVASIRTAIGLESNVVIIAELDGLVEDRSRSRLIYTAVSRARNHLIVLGTKAELRGTLLERLLPGGKLPPES